MTTPQKTDDTTNAWEALRLRLKARAAIERGWQAQMARDLNLSIGQLRDWTSGRREPSYSNGKRLEEYIKQQELRELRAQCDGWPMPGPSQPDTDARVSTPSDEEPQWEYILTVEEEEHERRRAILGLPNRLNL